MNCREATIVSMTLVVGANLLDGSLSIYFLFIYIKLILLTSEIEKHEVLRKCSFLFFYDGFVFHLSGLKKSGISIFLIIGIMVVRFIISPILGILIVKAAYYWGFIGSYSLYQFVLMLQYALPPATIVGMMTFSIFKLSSMRCLLPCNSFFMTYVLHRFVIKFSLF